MIELVINQEELTSNLREPMICCEYIRSPEKSAWSIGGA